MRWPDFFVVGSVKAGTTSLYNYLAAHPGLSLSRIKEPHFFCTDIDPSRFHPQYKAQIEEGYRNFLKGDQHKGEINAAFIRNESEYESLFTIHGDQKCGECSTSYLFSTVAAKHIYQKNPDAKIIIMLREPASRAFSHYLMNLKSGVVKGEFREELEIDRKREPKGWGISRLYLEHGYYTDQVKRYLDIFNREQVMIVLFDEFSADTLNSVRSVYKFLGVDPVFLPDTSRRHNEAMLPSSDLARRLMKRSLVPGFLKGFIPSSVKSGLLNAMYTRKGLPELSQAESRYLKTLYADDVKALGQLIGRDLKHWY